MNHLPRRQRLGAYAVLRRESDGVAEILLTRMSERTAIAGRWTLPGGGVDHGEDPWRTVVREVHEETGLRVAPTGVLTVTSTHAVGDRDGVPEDYHGVHIVFTAELRPESHGVEPVVLEQDSSTDVSRWVPLAEARSLPLLTAAAHVLDVPRAG